MRAIAEKLPLPCRDAFASTRYISALSALLSCMNFSSIADSETPATNVCAGNGAGAGEGTVRSTMRSMTRSRG